MRELLRGSDPPQVRTEYFTHWCTHAYQLTDIHFQNCLYLYSIFLCISLLKTQNCFEISFNISISSLVSFAFSNQTSSGSCGAIYLVWVKHFHIKRCIFFPCALICLRGFCHFPQTSQPVHQRQHRVMNERWRWRSGLESKKIAWI